MTFAYHNSNLITSYPIYSSELVVSFSAVNYNVTENGSIAVTLEASIAISQDYSIDVTLESGGQYVEYI